VVGIEAAAIGIFSACVDLRDGFDVLEARWPDSFSRMFIPSTFFEAL